MVGGGGVGGVGWVRGVCDGVCDGVVMGLLGVVMGLLGLLGVAKGC